MRMTKEEFLAYEEHFNRKEYDKLLTYFDPDLTVEYYTKPLIGAKPAGFLRGPEGFLKNYEHLHSTLREFLELGFFMCDDEHLIVELYTEFHAFKDTPDFSAGPLKKGDKYCITNWVCYDFNEEGKFKRIRIAHWRVHDPSVAKFDPNT